jgi:predicted AAA+ superfamily ATPase
MDEMYVFTNLDRLRKLVLGDMPNPDVGIRPVIHPLHWVDLSGETETLYFPADFNRKLSDFLNNLKKLLPQYSSDTNNFIYKSAKFIYGARGMGKSALVYRIARELGGDVYRYDFNDVVIQALSDYKMNNHLREFQRFVEKAKQLCKNGSIVILDNFIDPERLLNSQNLPFSEIYALTQLLEKLLKEPTGIIFVISRQPLSPKSSLMYYFDEIVHVPDSTKDSRKDFWSMLIPEAPTVHLDELKNHTMSFYEIKMLCERNRNPDGMISSTALIQSLANQKNDLDVKEGFVNIFSSIETTPLTPLEFPTQSEMESELDKEHEIEKMNAENTDISNEVNGRRDYPTAYPKGDYEPF